MFLFRLLLVLLAAWFAGCANPSITNVRPDAIASTGPGPVYVTRFEGRPDFVEEATDMFVARLQAKSRRRIIQGDAIREEGADVGQGGNIADRSFGIAAARRAGASLLVVGKVTSHHTEMMLNGFVTIRIIDTATGNIVGTIHRPSGLLVGNSEHQAVMAAARRVGDAAAVALR